MFAPHAAHPFPFARFGRSGTARTKRGPVVLERLLAWDAAWRDRRRLARMEPWRLADMGIGPDAARREAARPFWEG